MTGEELACRFHETYERLAPSFGYETRRDSAVPWESVPEKNRQLMVAVCDEVMTAALRQAADEAPERATQEPPPRCAGCGRETEPVPDCIRNEARLYGHRWWCPACGQAVCAWWTPAAAPAAETVRCMCPPGAVAGSCLLRNDVQSICECRCHGAPPSEPAPHAPDLRAVRSRITEYLSHGGLLNPEFMDHRAVSLLLRDARAAIDAVLAARAAKAKGEGKT